MQTIQNLKSKIQNRAHSDAIVRDFHPLSLFGRLVKRQHLASLIVKDQVADYVLFPGRSQPIARSAVASADEVFCRDVASI